MTFDIFLINIANIHHHFIDLQNDIFALQSTYVLLTETWMQPNQPIIWNNKRLSHASYGNGNGVCCYKPIHDVDSQDNTIVHPTFQMLSFYIMQNYQIILVYLSKNCSKTIVASALNNLIDHSKDVIILGDFNYKAGTNNEITRVLQNKKFQQIINFPTHIEANVIDHVYTNNSNLINVNYMFMYYSDHCAFHISLK